MPRGSHTSMITPVELTKTPPQIRRKGLISSPLKIRPSSSLPQPQEAPMPALLQPRQAPDEVSGPSPPSTAIAWPFRRSAQPRGAPTDYAKSPNPSLMLPNGWPPRVVKNRMSGRRKSYSVECKKGIVEDS
ncbi:hypothetical protein LOAG_13443 [Loa loa]|uniref:MBD domain-containing protein n=1 Tax=Loa loa TaxID=7209 RepID=A0A1I7VDW6_LOALO|nr:hypothetical protein LOAG_13443 [Loa loa]EFO15072.2 hypothetical protein LOAG_13443 [Loa loa]